MTDKRKAALDYFEIVWRQADGISLELNAVIRQALSEAPEVVSVEELMELLLCGHEDARFLMKRYPHGLIIGGDNGG